MTNIIASLAGFVKGQITSLVNAAPSDQVRVVFSAPPKAHIERLLQELTAEHGCLLIDTQRGSIKVPVYQIDPDVDDPHLGSMASRCTPNYFVNIRNRRNPPVVMLALQEVGGQTNQSIVTAVDPLGIAKEIADFKSWLDTPVVTYLLDQCRINLGFSQKDKQVNSALAYALEKTWAFDERYKDKRHVWQLLEKVLDGAGYATEPHLLLSAKLGLPSSTKTQLGSNAQQKILEKLSEIFTSRGLRGGFDELVRNAPSEQIPHLHALQSHIQDQDVLEANQFTKNALKIYSPIMPGMADLPEWWKLLTVDVWSELLDAGGSGDDPEKDIIKVTLKNSLVAVPKGLYPLVTESVTLDVSNTGDSSIDYIIERANGSANLSEEYAGSLDAGARTEYVDTDIPIHERFMRYKISAQGHAPIVVKVTVLDCYGPGVI